MNDVMVLKRGTNDTRPGFLYAVVRAVRRTAPGSDQEDEIDVQNVVGVPPRPYTRYKSSGTVSSRSWKDMIQRILNFEIVRRNQSGQLCEWYPRQ